MYSLKGAIEKVKNWEKGIKIWGFYKYCLWKHSAWETKTWNQTIRHQNR